MGTEQFSARYRGLDIWEPGEVLDTLVEGQLAAVAAVRAALPALQAAALAAEERLRRGGRLAYAGAGTSGRLAVQDGAELPATFGWPRDRLVLLLAGGEKAFVRSVEGAEDDVEEAARLVAWHRIREPDVLIAVAASGTTPFTLGCLREAGSGGALTIGIANNPATPLLDEAGAAILLDTGPEAIAGSTRMKAGTAQKAALNLLSSLVMIRLGRVHDGLMVDLEAVNGKLVRRSEAMLMHLAGCDREAAQRALAHAGGKVKLAALLLLQGGTVREAGAALEQAGGHLRAALQAPARRSRPRKAG